MRPFVHLLATCLFLALVPGPSGGAFAAPPFEGVIERTLEESAPWRPPEVEPPAGAPNIVILHVDDLGFADLGSFGSEIETPNLDRLAGQGLRYVNYTTHPLCAPARAALLTGRNAHAVGVGGNHDFGFPGYTGEIDPDVPTLAEILRARGYATMMVGKWHNTNDHHLPLAADRGSWPVARGFDLFYGFIGSRTDYFSPPHLIQGNEVVPVDAYPSDFYATDAWTGRAIAWIAELQASAPDRPFLLYVAYNTPHKPHQAPERDIEKYRGRYAGGWDAIRQARFERQLEFGVIPEGTTISPGDSGGNVAAWADLEPAEQRLSARLQEVYAAMIDRLDQNVGRLLAALEQAGLRERTMIVFTSDNGGSAGSGDHGAVFAREYDRLPPDEDLILRARKRGWIGGRRTYPGYPTGWAKVSNTPFPLYKGYTAAGGVRVPLIVSWPRAISDPGALRRQFVHVTDLVPTLLEEAGIEYPESFNGKSLPPADGRSFAATFGAPEAPPPRTAQYYEARGHRAYTDGRWRAVSTQRSRSDLDLDDWRLYDLERDLAETHDRAAEMPDKVQELSAAFEQAARANQVYPLIAGADLGEIAAPGVVENRTYRFLPGSGTVPAQVVQPLIADRDFTLRARFAYESGDQGVVAAVGDIHAGFLLYVDQGALRFTWNGFGRRIGLAPTPLEAGPVEVELKVAKQSGRRALGTLSVNGERVSEKPLYPTFVNAPYEGLDVGIDRRSPVHSRLARRHGPFPYTGRIDEVVIEPAPSS